MTAAAISIVFPFAMIYAIFSDAFTMKIANRASGLLVVSFLVLAIAAGFDWQTIGMHVVAGIVVLVVTFAFFAFGWMGGGDAKLLAATSLWIGWSALLMNYLLYASVIGGAFTLLLLMFRASPLAVYAGQLPLLRNLSDQTKGIPYGVALGIAGLLVFTETPLMQWAIAG